METEDVKPAPDKKPLRVLDVRLLDLRVGLVTNVQPLSFTDGKYFLTIDIGKPSEKLAPTDGLVGHYKLGALVDRKVVVACNLPTVFEDGEEATTKVMCAMTETQTEVLHPPKTAEPGERVFAPGFTQDNYWIVKQRNYDKIAVDLKVNSEGQAVYKDVPLQVEGRAGFITCKTLTNCPISHA